MMVHERENHGVLLQCGQKDCKFQFREGALYLLGKHDKEQHRDCQRRNPVMATATKEAETTATAKPKESNKGSSPVNNISSPGNAVTTGPEVDNRLVIISSEAQPPKKKSRKTNFLTAF